MSHILCFSWNSDKTQLCETYLENKTSHKISKPGGVFTKASSCYNPLFFDSILEQIKKYDPAIVAITTENDPVNGSYFHSKFLPSSMAAVDPNNSNNNYRLLVRDKYVDSDNTNVLRMSIYVRNDNTTIKSVELSKGIIFNDNKTSCGRLYSGEAKGMALYLQTGLGRFAFIGIQIPHRYEGTEVCIENMEAKFVNGKNLDSFFLMGDFANDFTLNDTDKGQNLFDVIDQIRSGSIPTGVTENLPGTTAGRKKELVPTYSRSYTDKFVNDAGTNRAARTFEDTVQNTQGNLEMGYHDRIFYNHIKGFLLNCIEYRAILGSPMLLNSNPNVSRTRNHLGVLGVYEASNY
jgi:hypothetical protein